MNSQLIKIDKNVKYLNKAKRLRKVGKVGLIENQKNILSTDISTGIGIVNQKKK